MNTASLSMRGTKNILLLSTAVIVAMLGAFVAQNLPSRAANRDPHNTFFTNLRRINEAKQQWALDRKAPSDAWPSKQDILGYLRPQAGHGFDTTLPSLVGEAYILNRADRPALVYFPKKADDFREGQLLTMEDLERHYDSKFGRGL